jgi:hypothetical protein
VAFVVTTYACDRFVTTNQLRQWAAQAAAGAADSGRGSLDEAWTPLFLSASGLVTEARVRVDGGRGTITIL